MLWVFGSNHLFNKPSPRPDLDKLSHGWKAFG